MRAWTTLRNVPKLYGMASGVRNRSGGIENGRALRAQRVSLGLTQEQVVELSNGVLYPRLISEIETGKRHVADLSLEQAMTYASILGYAPERLVATTSVTFDLPSAASIPDATKYTPTLALPHFGDVSAGLHPGDGGMQEQPFYVDPTLSGIRGRSAKHLAAMRVNGDSMVSPKTRDSIPRGATVVVEMGAVAQHGDTVIAWLNGLELSVLKKFEEGDEVVLSSLNPNGPVFRAGEHDIDIRGVVRLIIRPP